MVVNVGEDVGFIDEYNIQALVAVGDLGGRLIGEYSSPWW